MMIKVRAITPVFLAIAGVPALLFSQTTLGAVISYSYDRTTPYSSIEMCRTQSTGESLTDSVPAQPDVFCHRETPGGDIGVTINWADSSSDAGIWAAGAVGGLPGVSLGAGGNFATLSETGDTFIENWTLLNLGGSNSAITRIVLTALGAPDMGFDTDDGANPNHGAGGFPLLFISASNWNGSVNVAYDRWNNWNGTTDMFHRMTLTFVDNLPVGSNFVFQQDTDEIPLPGTLSLVLIGLAGFGLKKHPLVSATD